MAAVKKHIKHLVISSLTSAGLLLMSHGFAAGVVLKRNHPSRYIVKAGDTLWGVAAKFLKYPWQWQDLWEHNSHIRNPHVLYPGNLVKLIYKKGRPYLTLASGGTIKLSPKIRKQKLYTPIPTIPVSSIKHFLAGAQIVGKHMLDRSPYILTLSKEHLSGATGVEFYARGFCNRHQKKYVVFKKGNTYRDPDTKKIIGYEAVDVARATMIKYGDPSKFVINRLTQEVLPGYRLLPDTGEHFKTDFIPRPPKFRIDAKIAGVADKDLENVGSLYTVVLNRGSACGLRPGHVLDVYEPGRKIHDEYTTNHKKKMVQLPDERIGELMVFRTFKNMSYAIVLQANMDINYGDLVTNPTL